MLRIVLPLLLALAACTPATPGLDHLGGRANERVPTAVVATWENNGIEGDTWVEYGLGEAKLNRSTPAGTEATATMLALTAGHTWYFRAVTVDADGTRWESEVRSVDVKPAPTRLPTFTISDRDDAAIDPNALVFTTLLQDGGSWIVGLTRDGEYAWWYESESAISIPSIHPAANHHGLMFTHHSEQEGKTNAGMLRMSFDGLEQVLTVGDGHHDVVQLPDGNVVWIRNENPLGVTLEDGDMVDLSVDTLVENEEGAPEADASVRFSFIDDYPHTPWNTYSHFKDEGQGGGNDYTHANSVMYDELNDALLVMSKNLDALVSVDRQTGAIRWQAGGRFGDIADESGDSVSGGPDAWDVDGPNHTWWSHSHMSDFWGSGFLVFDNGYHHEPQASRVVEYAFSEENHTLRKVWELPEEGGLFNPLLGDARRLPGGNTLISWTVAGELMEVTPDSTVVWRAAADVGSATGRLVYVADIYDVE